MTLDNCSYDVNEYASKANGPLQFSDWMLVLCDSLSIELFAMELSLSHRKSLSVQILSSRAVS